MEGICTTPLPLYPGDSQRATRGSPLERLVSRPVGSLAGASLSEPPVEGIDLGRRVIHQVFGEGVVTQFEGRGSNARVEVNFSEGSKWLVLQYANLTVL